MGSGRWFDPSASITHSRHGPAEPAAAVAQEHDGLAVRTPRRGHVAGQFIDQGRVGFVSNLARTVRVDLEDFPVVFLALVDDSPAARLQSGS